LVQTLVQTLLGFLTPPTPYIPLPLPFKTLDPSQGSRVVKGKGQAWGHPELTPGLPLPITTDRTFIDNPDLTSGRFRSFVLLKVLAAMLHFFWKLGALVGFINMADQRVNIRILAIPVSFVSPFILTTTNYTLACCRSSTNYKNFQLYQEIWMNDTSECQWQTVHIERFLKGRASGPEGYHGQAGQDWYGERAGIRSSPIWLKIFDKLLLSWARIRVTCFLGLQLCSIRFYEFPKPSDHSRASRAFPSIPKLPEHFQDHPNILLYPDYFLPSSLSHFYIVLIAKIWPSLFPNLLGDSDTFRLNNIPYCF
jgi:hypothetical protein